MSQHAADREYVFLVLAMMQNIITEKEQKSFSFHVFSPREQVLNQNKLKQIRLSEFVFLV
jgi:hypothetical protein